MYGKTYIGDYWIILLLLLLFGIGLVVLYSATKGCELAYTGFFVKQVSGLFVGIILGAFASLISYRTLLAWGRFLHCTVLATLGFTLIRGSTAMGAKRWINLIFFKFQPAELAKLTLPLYIVGYLALKVHQKNTYSDWFHLLSVVGLTFFLIVKQPDLGSALIVSGSALIILFVIGLPRKIILLFTFIFALCGPLVWIKLHDYQKRRILTFMGYGSSKKERYQIEQSQIAVGSGMLTGKGFLNGTQKKFKFLPENRTDFIFAVLCEEWGFLGALFVLLLYTLVIMRLFLQSDRIRNVYGNILAFGLVLPFALSALCNIAMVIGLLPVVGIPLPCMSYGLTNLWITLISLGITNNILSYKDD